jgi:hypothetical protein
MNKERKIYTDALKDSTKTNKEISGFYKNYIKAVALKPIKIEVK